MQHNIREVKGQQLLNSVKRIDANTYQVKSQSGNGFYDIISTELGWVCNCPDHMYRGVTCKHIYSVEISQQIRQQVQNQIVISEITNVCPQCKSEQIVKHGIRHNKYGDVQRYSCLNCYKRFTNNLGFEKMRASPQMITSAMQLYFTNESFRNVQKFLKLQGVEVSHMAIYKWVKKYVTLMEKYLDTIKPNVSNVWRTDELYLRVKKDTKYLFALMDDETRFWISQQVSDNKNTSDVRPMFKKGIELTGKKPTVLISDGAHNFHTAYKKEFLTLRKPTTRHIRHITIKGEKNNNKMERLNNEIRDFEKTKRSIKTIETPILKGYEIYHNYIRPHEALDNSTPSEKCGIKIEGKNKWKTLIENASQITY